MPFAGSIFKIKLGITVLWYPNHAGGYFCIPAKRNKQARHFLAVTTALAQRLRCVLQRALNILDVVTNKIVNLLDASPCIRDFLSRQASPRRLDPSIAAIDIRTTGKEETQVPANLCRNDEIVSLSGTQNPESFDGNVECHFDRRASGHSGHFQHHLLHSSTEFTGIPRGDLRINRSPGNGNLLLWPIHGHRESRKNVCASHRRFKHQTDSPVLNLWCFVTESRLVSLLCFTISTILSHCIGQGVRSERHYPPRQHMATAHQTRGTQRTHPNSHIRTPTCGVK